MLFKLPVTKGEATSLRGSLFEGSPNSSFYGSPGQGEEALPRLVWGAFKDLEPKIIRTICYSSD